MPIEIRELVIRTTVTGGEESSSTPPSRPSSAAASGGGRIDRSALVAECVEQVMEILREGRER